ncbi:MAG: hypothetical protein FJ317_05090 [SAR202 cluster bacterium]|nr:hypothetical protein [SAR202 cluster bacterium]
MIAKSCDMLLSQLRGRIEGEMHVYPFRDSGCIVNLPFRDSSGDPLSVIVTEVSGQYVVHDAGIIASRLFSLAQNIEGTPAYRLLGSLAKAYDLDVDFNEGLVRLRADEHDLSERVLDLAKVMVTVITASPHIRIQTFHQRRLGPRLRGLIRRRLENGKILDWVEQNYTLSGRSVEEWAVDFYWRTSTQEDNPRNIYVMAVDLDTAHPLRKAEHITALALDIKQQLDRGSLRVVADTHGANSEASVAMDFLAEHKIDLNYSLTDYTNTKQREEFYAKCVQEVVPNNLSAWRDVIG